MWQSGSNTHSKLVASMLAKSTVFMIAALHIPIPSSKTRIVHPVVQIAGDNPQHPYHIIESPSNQGHLIDPVNKTCP